MLNLLPGVSSTTAALNVERTRLDVIAQNIANAKTTRGLDGKPYQRQQVVFEAVLEGARAGANGVGQVGGPRISRIEKDQSPSRSIYQPGHPDADKDGMVQMPNVDVYAEMADMIAAGRSFDANIAVLKTAKQMTTTAIALQNITLCCFTPTPKSMRMIRTPFNA